MVFKSQSVQKIITILKSTNDVKEFNLQIRKFLSEREVGGISAS